MVTLIDRFNRPLAPKKQVLTSEIAAPTVTGVRQHSMDHPSIGLTPARLASLLKSAETDDPHAYFKLAEDLEEKDLQYLTVLGTRKRAVAQLDIEIIPGGDGADDVKNAEIVENWLQRDTLEDEIFDMADAVGKGISLTEIIWETSERQWMPARLEYVHPTFLQFDRIDKKTPYLKAEGGPQPLPPYKFIYCQIKAKSGVPLRGGLARPVAWAYLFKNYDIKGWVQFLEVYGQPMRLGKFGTNASEEEKRILLRAVRDIGADAAAVIPAGMEIEFVSDTGSKGGDGHEKLAKYMDYAISKVVLGQSTTTDAISGGHAVSKEHNDVRGDIERADAKALAAVINQQLIRPMIELNRGPQAAYPRIRIGRPESVNIPELAAAVSTLSPLMPFSARQVYAKIGLSPPEDDEDAVGGPSKAKQEPDAKPAPEDDDDEDVTAARAAHTHEDEVDALTELALGDWQELMEPMVSPIRDLVERATSYEEVRDGLIGLLEEMDDEALTTSLANAGFNIRLAAQVGAIGEDEE